MTENELDQMMEEITTNVAEAIDRLLTDCRRGANPQRDMPARLCGLMVNPIGSRSRPALEAGLCRQPSRLGLTDENDVGTFRIPASLLARADEAIE